MFVFYRALILAKRTIARLITGGNACRCGQWCRSAYQVRAPLADSSSSKRRRGLNQSSLIALAVRVIHSLCVLNGRGLWKNLNVSRVKTALRKP